MIRPGPYLRPHWILLGVAGLLLITAHGASSEFTDSEEIQVSSSFLPVVVQISTEDERRSWTIGPFQEVETGMDGPANVTIAPALPGTSLLIAHGPTAAFVPLVTFTCIMAFLFKVIEPRPCRNGQRTAALPGVHRSSNDREEEKKERNNERGHDPKYNHRSRTRLQERRDADKETP